MATSPSDPFDPRSDPAARRVAAGLARLGVVLRSRAWRQGGARGLTPTQGQLLTALARRAGGQRLGTLAEALGVTAATASDAVSALARKGLVRKAREAGDARALVVTLTARGGREARRALAWPDFLAEAVEELRPDEQAVLLRGLVTIIRRLQERGEIAPARTCVTCRFFRPDVHDDAARPHHCAFVDAPFGDRSLRLDCPDHEPAPTEQARRAWKAFAAAATR
jgi:DNA-binding MarR family transcriptional regulator